MNNLKAKITQTYQADPKFRAFMAEFLRQHERVTPFLTGGFVRDSLFGITPDDYDIVIDEDVPLEDIEKLGKKYGSTWLKPTFGIRIDVPGEKHIDIWRFIDYRVRHSTVHSIEEVLLDFDFNVNALGYNLRTGEFVDPIGVLNDYPDVEITPTDKCYLRPPLDRSVAALRALKLTVRVGLPLSEATKEFIHDNRTAVKDLTWEVEDSVGAYLENPQFRTLLEKYDLNV